MSLSLLVDPAHPVVGRLLDAARARATASGSAGDPVSALRGELAHWRYAARSGPSSYEAVEAAREGNCIDLATLLCAAIRRSGNRACHVLLGSWRGAFPATVHAWVVLRSAPDRWLLIDTADMTANELAPAAIEERLTITAIFDESQVIVSRATRDSLWRAPGVDEEQDVQFTGDRSGPGPS